MYTTNHVSDEFVVTGLTRGLFYQFKLEARNAYGYSFFSDILELRSALVPDQPVAPSTDFVWASDEIRVSGGDDATGTTNIYWSAPDD